MTSYYSRLFGGPSTGHDEMYLRELSMRMKDVPENRRGRRRTGDLAPSAFVYLGQFLDHDLTRDETRLEHASADWSAVIYDFRKAFCDPCLARDPKNKPTDREDLRGVES